MIAKGGMVARGRRVAREIHAARGLGVMRIKLQQGEGGGGGTATGCMINKEENSSQGRELKPGEGTVTRWCNAQQPGDGMVTRKIHVTREVGLVSMGRIG
jgi:hypothetical protein